MFIERFAAVVAFILLPKFHVGLHRLELADFVDAIRPAHIAENAGHYFSPSSPSLRGEYHRQPFGQVSS